MHQIFIQTIRLQFSSTTFTILLRVTARTRYPAASTLKLCATLTMRSITSAAHTADWGQVLQSRIHFNKPDYSAPDKVICRTARLTVEGDWGQVLQSRTPLTSFPKHFRIGSSICRSQSFAMLLTRLKIDSWISFQIMM